jgi:hypothetical protein
MWVTPGASIARTCWTLRSPMFSTVARRPRAGSGRGAARTHRPARRPGTAGPGWRLLRAAHRGRPRLASPVPVSADEPVRPVGVKATPRPTRPPGEVPDPRVRRRGRLHGADVQAVGPDDERSWGLCGGGGRPRAARSWAKDPRGDARSPQRRPPRVHTTPQASRRPLTGPFVKDQG